MSVVEVFGNVAQLIAQMAPANGTSMGAITR